ncbi:proton-coupled folate transporter-like [Homarus americanus]|uniref:proton-coupled folate transporter-like n=1 Tax=Homarus americanus TaxID=6706 RepID=UPI001C4463A9|nr:proton-coupled folate transporter-like [Homarus americanus]
MSERQQKMEGDPKNTKGWSSRVMSVMKSVTVEPLMLLDGLAFSNMHVYIENMQMERVCRVGSGFSQQVCDDLKSDPAASVEVQQRYSVFALYNGIIAAALPLFFILFMGAWSDKYGRKVPLVAVQVGHVLHAAGYLLASLAPQWPAEMLLLVTLLDTLGGGTVSFLTAANSYISDVSSEESRTSRVGLANSIWFLGGPVGTLMGTYIYTWGGYLPLFATSLTLSLMAVVYVVVCLPESHGPFARKAEANAPGHKSQVELRDSVAVVYGMEVKATPSSTFHNTRPTLSIMIKDFFNPRRIFDSFKSTLRQREGNTRALILILIFTSLLRRVTRSPYVFAFTRHVLGWEASDYSLWVTYKNLVATTGSLVAVPLLSGRLGVADNVLAMVGAMSGVLEYVVYGCISDTRPYFIWIAPVAALLLNSCTIAQRAMMTKFVARDEIGKVSAVLGALDGLMPMVNSALYTAIYHATVSVFPSAHFFLGASASGLMIVFFCVIMCADKSGQYDVEGAKPSKASGPITNKSLVMRTDSWLATDSLALALSTPSLPVLPDHYNIHHHHIDLQKFVYQKPEATVKSSSGNNSNIKSHKLIHSIKTSLRAIMRPGEASCQDVVTVHKPDARMNISNLFVNINNITNQILIPKTTRDSVRVGEESQNNVNKVEKTLPPV